MDHFVNELTYQVIIIRIVAAIIIGGMIGYEREKNNRPAGFRTHILVCLGACIISLIQDGLRLNLMMLIQENPAAGNVLKTDLGRLGAQVISGIGFLGAGSIMRERGTIGGLTTAASIWATGCMGLAIGWGFYRLTFIGAIAVILTLIVLKKLEVRWIAKRYVTKILVKYKDGLSAEIVIRVSDTLKEEKVKILGVTKDEEEKQIIFAIRLRKSLRLSEILAKIANLPEIETARREEESAV